MISFRKKITVSIAILIFAVGGFYFPQPKKAQALFGIDWCGEWFICLNPLSDVPNIVSATENGITSGATTVSAGIDTAKFASDGTPWERIVTDAALSSTFCDSYGDANLFLDAADRAGKIIAGADKSSVSNTFFPTYKVESTQAIINTCWVPLNKAAQIAKGGTISQAENVEHNRALAASEEKAAEAKLVEYEKAQDQGFSDVFQGIMYNFTAAVAKEAAVKGVNALTKTLGNRDPFQLAKALTNQVYAIQQINDNYGGNEEGMLIAASLLKNKTLGDVTGLTTAVNLSNEQARKYQVPPSAMIWSDPNFYTKMATAGDENAWSQVQLMKADDKATAALTLGHEMAHAEMQTGNGYKNIRSCSDVTAQQTKVNADLAAATTKVDEAYTTVQILSGIFGADLETAQKNYADAQTALAAVKAKVGSSIIAPCPKGIITSAQTVSNAADKWLATLFDQTKFNTANPTLAGTIASKLGKSLFDGLFNGSSGSTFGSTLIDTGKSLIPFGISAGLQELTGGSSTPSASFPPKKTPTGVSGEPSPPNGTSAYISKPGTVAGAYTIQPRGPVVPFLPRGPEPVTNH